MAQRAQLQLVPAGPPPTIREVFDAHAAYVGRSLRCLGVAEADLPDACQEVFLVVHRRLGEFEGRSKLATWLYAICVRTAMTHRRRASRRHAQTSSDGEPGAPASQEDRLEQADALALALRILEGLDDEKRAIFVLYEVEELSMSDVADAVGCPLQTAYSRLYAARREVEQALRRERARERSA